MILSLSLLVQDGVRIALQNDMAMKVPGPALDLQTEVKLEFVRGLLGFEAEIAAVERIPATTLNAPGGLKVVMPMEVELADSGQW